MGSYPVRTALAIHRYSQVHWTKTALGDSLLSYDFETSEVTDLVEEDVPAGERPRGVGATSTSADLPAIFVVYLDRYHELV